jgi:nitroreductase
MNFDMPLHEAMETQRAIRRLKPDPVDEALILRLIELAIKAPTGSNAQNWEFIIVRDAKVKQGLARLNRQIWTPYSWIGRRVSRRSPKNQRTLKAVQWQADHYTDAPVIIVACLKAWYFPLTHILKTTYFGSIFPAVQNLLLAARAAHLGATLTTFPVWNLFAMRRILGLPWNITPCAVIPLGWPLGRWTYHTKSRP